MGIFNSIKFKYPLPALSNYGELTPAVLQEEVYQTKDLDRGMDYYEVTESGQLMREERETEYIFGDNYGKTFSERFGYIQTLKSWFEPHKRTETIIFYALINDDSRKMDYWVEFEAVFADGQVQSIKEVKFEATDNTERKARDAKWKADLAATYEFRKKWYMRFLYIPYESAVRWIFRKYSLLKWKLPPSYKVERFLTPF